MIAVEPISAIAPGWFIVAALALLAVALLWVYLAGEAAEEQIDRLTEQPEEPKTVQLRTSLYDWETERAGGVR